MEKRGEAGSDGQRAERGVVTGQPVVSWRGPAARGRLRVHCTTSESSLA